jgi:hypothetical protein
MNSGTYLLLKNDISLFTIKNNGNLITPNFSVSIGALRFTDAQTVGTYLVSGSYVPIVQAGGCFEWAIDIKNNVLDKTVFGNTWEAKQPGMHSWTATAKRYWVDSTASGILLGTQVPLIWRFYIDVSNDKSWVGYAYMDSLKATDAKDQLVTEDISIVGVGNIVQV